MNQDAIGEADEYKELEENDQEGAGMVAGGAGGVGGVGAGLGGGSEMAAKRDPTAYD